MSSNIFGEGETKYDTGKYPQIALSTEYFVEVHQSENFPRLWYHAGSLRYQKGKKQPIIEWGPSVQLTNGVNPKVAVNSQKIVVAVHKSELLDNLFYQVGIVDPAKKVTWGQSLKYESGSNPTIAINDSNFIVEVHQQKDGSLVAGVGVVDEKKLEITFGNWEKITSNGSSPHVSIGTNAVLEVHQEDDQKLCYKVGILEGAEKKVKWGSFHLFDKGSNASCSIGGQDNLTAILTYQSLNQKSMSVNLGRISLTSMDVRWNGVSVFGQGVCPSVSANQKGVVLHVHRSQENTELLYELSALLPCIAESVKGVGVATDQNKAYRGTMEDEDVIIDGICGTDSIYVGVYDGHGGRQTVELLRDHLHNFLLQSIQKFDLPNKRENLNQMWIESFANTDKLVLSTIGRPKEERGTSGSTAAVALIWSSTQTKERFIDTANIGDARTVLVRAGKAIRMSYDHKATDPQEKKRVESLGGLILMDKVCASLAVTRAFGDTEFKEWVTAEPYCDSTKLTDQDSHLIVACDGLWDVMSDQEVADFITSSKFRDQPQKLSEKLLQLALEKGTRDNVSIIVLRL